MSPGSLLFVEKIPGSLRSGVIRARGRFGAKPLYPRSIYLKQIFCSYSKREGPIEADLNKYLLSLIMYPERLSWMFNAHLHIHNSIRRSLQCVWEASEAGVIILCTSIRLSFLRDLSQVYLRCCCWSEARRWNSREGRRCSGQLPTCIIGKTLVFAKSFVPATILSFWVGITGKSELTTASS